MGKKCLNRASSHEKLQSLEGSENCWAISKSLNCNDCKDQRWNCSLSFISNMDQYLQDKCFCLGSLEPALYSLQEEYIKQNSSA
jgi:hypothetical protein